ncbi:hypothetical protein SUGI_0593300 [Cryptomeria japonica]|uniref:protein SYM1 n=1 Tax=Cryptomeria japonica TaxID=3369 RepID=UPI0024147B8F|nr:protein SYM1 [Cryptomeria japonica]GLJ30013.1 hypothetical protein SUGI_0593300 [Cryptomeria japonica]
MLGAWRWYQNQLTKNPVRTQIISSGILWATGDVAAQYVSFSTKKRLHLSTDKQKKKFKVDWKRVATTSMFGLGFVGPVGHFWYEGLEHVTKHRLRLRPNSLQFVTAKLAADTLIFGPVHLLAFFTYMGLASGKKLDQVKEDVKRDLLPAFMMEGSTWTLVQTVNFRFVPVRYQLLYVNFFCLLDSAFLSWFEQQEDAPWKRWLKSLLSA